MAWSSTTKVWAALGSVVTLVGGAIVVYQFVTGHQNLPEAIAGTRLPKGENQGAEQYLDLNFDASTSKLVKLPVQDEPGPSHLLIVFKKGDSGPPRVGYLYAQPNGRWVEKTIFKAPFSAETISASPDNSQFSAATIKKASDELKSDEKMTFWVFDKKAGAGFTKSITLSECKSVNISTIRKLVLDGAVLHLVLNTGCGFAAFTDDEGDNSSLTAFGDYTNSPVVVSFPSNGVCTEKECIKTCSLYDAATYEDYVWQYGHTGAPERCGAKLAVALGVNEE
jgi:hypothetical protein